MFGKREAEMEPTQERYLLDRYHFGGTIDLSHWCEILPAKLIRVRAVAASRFRSNLSNNSYSYMPVVGGTERSFRGKRLCVARRVHINHAAWIATCLGCENSTYDSFLQDFA